jgi:opacity protein-like surface antigen
MKKSITVIGMVVLFALTAAAQDVPQMETFLGYTYVRANSATNVPAFSANGGSGQFVYNFNRWIAGVADIGAVHNGNIGGAHLDSTITNFLFGPRVALRYSRLTPYFQTLFGGVYAASSTKILVLNPADAQTVSARLSTSQTGFGMTVGGGLDFKITKHLSFRPIGLDYYLTRLQNLRSQTDNNQNNLRYTTGVNFTFGAQ